MSAVAHHVLSLLASRGFEEEDTLVFDGESMLVNAAQISSSGKTHKEFQLKLAEAVALHHHNFQVLEGIVLALHKLNGTGEFLERVSDMVESFLSLVGEWKQVFELGSPGLRMDDENMMERVLFLLKGLASGASEGHAVG